MAFECDPWAGVRKMECCVNNLLDLALRGRPAASRTDAHRVFCRVGER